MGKKTAKQKNKPSFFLSLILTSAVSFLLGLSVINVIIFITPDTLPVQTQIDDEILYWTRLVEKHPTYREGYLKIAELEMKKGNKADAFKALGEAQKTDPNKFFY